MYYLYAIGTESMLLPPYEYCYVGVTNNLDRRWINHTTSSYTVGKFIRKHNLVKDKNMIVIFEGDEEKCFDLEAEYRPLPMIGLNEASGGRGGYTSYSEQRNNKISNSHKGKKKPADQVEKMRATILKNGRAGAKNGRAKKWTLISPSKEIYDIEGDLSETCRKYNILESTMRYYKNEVVPTPNNNGYGGYRAKSKESFEMRINTTGWSLMEVSKHSGGVL